MSRPGRALIGLLALNVVAGGCTPVADELPGFEVERRDVEFRVMAEGELVASESLPITMPGAVRMPFNIAWMAPEFSEVRAGDVIARFDDVQIRLDRESTALNVAKSGFQLAGTSRDSQLERTRIDHEVLRVDRERNISETFATADERLFSRNELIDALADLDYLDVEASFLDWQLETLDQRTQAERNLIRAEQEGELSKLEKQDTALSMMELRSPADGTFIYAETPWGEKLSKGKTVFPGMPIGLLPVRGKVEARLFVPEADAVGLASGQPVRLRLDAVPGRQFIARVATVSPVASPRNRDDPQKYFIVEAEIDAVDPNLMRVGSRVRAEVVTGQVDDAVVVPAQTVHGEADDLFIYVVSGDRAERRAVMIGRRSPDLIEIRSGVQVGDRISLVAPAGRS